MSLNDLQLLIKSKFSLIFIETQENEYVINSLRNISRENKLILYEWTETLGLKRDENQNPFYKTNQPYKMLEMISFLTKNLEINPGIFMLRDFDSYVKDAAIQRFFKDLVIGLANTKNKIVILSAEYKNIKDVEKYTALISVNPPNSYEIAKSVLDVVEELKKNEKLSKIKLDKKNIEIIASNLYGLSIQQIRDVLTESILDDNILGIQNLEIVKYYKEKIIGKKNLLEFCLKEPKENFANYDNIRKKLPEIKNLFYEERANYLGFAKGVLMIGISGCGKSYATKYLANELDLPLYKFDINKLNNIEISQLENYSKDMLKLLEDLSPMCLWIDEIEKIFSKIDQKMDSGISEKISKIFLSWLKRRTSKCFLIATSNDVYVIPTNILQDFFYYIFFMDLPDKEIRTELFHIHLKKRNLDIEKFDLNKLSENSVGFSCSEIEQSIIYAFYGVSKQKESIVTEDILVQIRNINPISKSMNCEIETLKTWAKEKSVIF